ncbi:hypothetical protein GCM10020000_39470 [Streptomyces olivoverticillatus]
MPETRHGIPLTDAEEDLAPSPAVAVARRRLLAHPVFVMLGIVLASLNMRAALAGVSPLMSEISGHFGLTAAASSLLTTIPLIFMGLGSIVAPKLARRFGTEAVLCGALLLLCGGASCCASHRPSWRCSPAAPSWARRSRCSTY